MLRLRGRGARAAELRHERGALLLAHRRHPNVHALDAERGERRLHVAGDAVLERAPGDREQDVHADDIALDLDGLEHAEVLDRPPDLGVEDVPQRIANLLLGHHRACSFRIMLMDTVRTVGILPVIVRPTPRSVDARS